MYEMVKTYGGELMNYWSVRARSNGEEIGQIQAIMENERVRSCQAYLGGRKLDGAFSSPGSAKNALVKDFEKNQK